MSSLFKERIKILLQDFGLHCRPARNVPVGTSRVLYSDVLSATEPVIFDIGANLGQTVMAFRHNVPNALIYAFEPITEIFQELKRRFSGEAKTRCFPLAMGSAVETREIELGSTDPECTTHRITPAARTPTGGRRQIQITTVDEFVRENGIERIHILKSDTEGNEIEVLKGAKQSLSTGKIQAILVETTLVENPIHVDLDDVKAHLMPYGFQIEGVYDPVYSQNGGMHFCNALFKLRRGAVGGNA